MKVSTTMTMVFAVLLGLTLSTDPAWSAPSKNKPAYRVIEMPSRGLPITALKVVFRVGSADDPVGKRGLAFLTARLLREGGVAKFENAQAMSRERFEAELYPLGSDIDVSLAREQTGFHVLASEQNVMRAFQLMQQMILAPAFDANEFERLKREQIEALKNQLPREDQEELGKAALERQIYGEEHAYAHVLHGRLKDVESITLNDVREFAQKFFTRKRLTVGVAGVIPANLKVKLAAGFAGLPEGDSTRAEVAEPKTDSARLLIVKGPFDATGVHIGQPLSVVRGQSQFPILYLAAQAFGKHRSFVGRLMHVVREERGLNYGTYSYVEEFPMGGRYLNEQTQVARSKQAFTMWGRPARLENGCFLLKQMYREASSLAAKGLRADEFDLAQGHLVGSVPIQSMALERKLGYAIDAEFYGLNEPYAKWLQRGVRNATLTQTNALLKQTLKPSTMRIVVVTPDPSAFQKALELPECGITYGAGIEKSEQVKKEDSEISRFKIDGIDGHIRVIESETLY